MWWWNSMDFQNSGNWTDSARKYTPCIHSPHLSKPVDFLPKSIDVISKDIDGIPAPPKLQHCLLKKNNNKFPDLFTNTCMERSFPWRAFRKYGRGLSKFRFVCENPEFCPEMCYEVLSVFGFFLKLYRLYRFGDGILKICRFFSIR